MNISCPHCHSELALPNGFTGGKLSCSVCDKPFMCDAKGVIYVATAREAPPVQAPQKKPGKVFMRRRKPTYAEMKRRTMSTSYGQSEESDNGTLCFWLGFLFWVMGVVIAAIIGKENGVKKALLGMLIDTILWVIIYVLFLGAVFTQLH